MEGFRASGLFQDFRASSDAFHWHGDTFAVPQGALHVARSAAYGSQAFVHEDRLVGRLFPLESTEEGVERLLRHCSDEITEGPHIQDSKTIRNHAPLWSPKAWALLKNLLDHMAISPPAFPPASRAAKRSGASKVALFSFKQCS